MEEGGNLEQIDQVWPDSKALFEEFTAVIVVDRWPTWTSCSLNWMRWSFSSLVTSSSKPPSSPSSLSWVKKRKIVSSRCRCNSPCLLSILFGEILHHDWYDPHQPHHHVNYHSHHNPHLHHHRHDHQDCISSSLLQRFFPAAIFVSLVGSPSLASSIKCHLHICFWVFDNLLLKHCHSLFRAIYNAARSGHLQHSFISFPLIQKSHCSSFCQNVSHFLTNLLYLICIVSAYCILCNRNSWANIMMHPSLPIYTQA